MKVLFCSSEVVPFAKTGGLADVAGTLPLALAAQGVNVKIIMPRYQSINVKKFKLEPLDSEAFIGKLDRNVEVYFIEKKRFFGREGLYQDEGIDYPDNLMRFSHYCVRSLELIKKIKFKPTIVHCNDWQTALIPVYLKTLYKNDSFFKEMKTIFTIHNLGYQGLFPKEQFSQTGLPGDLFTMEGLEFYNKVNLLKGGLLFSDKITTVSSAYAKEIQTTEFGCGLEGILQHREKDLMGILNGINYDEWDPGKNEFLIQNYTQETIEGKYINKTDLQKITGLAIDEKIPLLGMITRLADQKGLDIFSEVIDKICKFPLQFVLLGTGDPKYHKIFQVVKSKYKNTSVNLRFDPGLAYKIYAGSDMFIMPSYYEPCGLGQLISFNFGTIPIVRSTGGLADTVIDYSLDRKKGNGFVFKEYSSAALLDAVERALDVYKSKKNWIGLVKRVMKYDFGWRKSAKEYLKLYKTLSK